MTSTIVIPFDGIVDMITEKKVKSLIVKETGRLPYVRSQNGDIIVKPESPIHESNIMDLLEELELNYIRS